MSVTLKSALLTTLFAGALACKDQPPSAAVATEGEASSGTLKSHHDEAEHEGLPNKVRLSSDVIREAGVKTAPATLEVLPPVVQLTGELAADPDAMAEVTVRSTGRVVEVDFKEGDRVKKGQRLAVIESSDAARTRASVTSTLAKARSARLNAERIGRLTEKGLAAGQEAANADSEATALEAEADAARQALLSTGGVAEGRGRLELRAPITGFILRRNAVIGQALAADFVLASIANLDEGIFLGRLFEKDLARIQPGAACEVRLNAYPDRVFLGVVESVGKQLDDVARTVITRIRVKDDSGAFKVGLFGTARVVVAQATPPRANVVVPLSATTQLSKRTVVFVKHADGDFEVHPVTLGRTASGKAEVLSGLRAGEEVVVEGLFTLKSAVLKSTFGEEQ